MFSRVKNTMRSLATVAALALFCGVCLAQAPENQSASPLGNKDAAKSETAIGDLVTDAMKKQVRTDVAFVPACELKPKDTPFPAGTIAPADIEALVSYPDDPLAVLELPGKTIRLALEKSVSIYPQPYLGFLQVAGLRFTFDPKKPPGERVTSITVGATPINDAATYTVAVTNTMANGALGYWKVWSKDRVKDRRDRVKIVTALDAFFKTNPKIDYGTLDRITILK